MGGCVILQGHTVITPLGPLSETVDRLVLGHSAIIPGSIFGIPVASAPFADTRCRGLEEAVSRLSESLPTGGVDPSRSVFLSCSVKGDLAGLESGNDDGNGISPCLQDQAHYAARCLGGEFASVMALSGACASGAIAVEIARELLLGAEFDHAVIFGLDTLSRFVVSGFHSLGALSLEGARPFDRDRDGLTPGEAAACAVLSRGAPRPGDIVIAGAASSNDANHRTGPSRTGDGLFRAAQSALADAGTGPDAIGAVKCHGTATVYNDSMEAKAVSRLFGEAIPPCFSVKGALGHASGTGALAEILIAAHCLRGGLAPPTARFRALGVEETIPVFSEPAPLRHPAVLCLSAGFGGINGAVVLRRHGVGS